MLTALTMLFAMGSIAQEDNYLILSNVNVIDVDNGAVSSGMSVLIQNSQIIRVSDQEIPAPAQNIQYVDGQGGYLIPGLWDVHVHLSYTQESALPALIANGVTYVRDMGSKLEDIEALRGQIKNGELAGPEILRAGPILNDQKFNDYQLQVTNEAEARTAVRTLHKVGVDFIKLHRRTSREAYFGIVDEAGRLGIPFAGHIPMSVSPLEASNAGQATIEHTETLFEGTFMTAEAANDLVGAISRWRESDATSLFQAFVKNNTAFAPTLIVWQELVDALEAEKTDPRQRYISAESKQVAADMLQQLGENKNAFLAQRKPIIREFQRVVNLASQTGVSIIAGTDLASGFVYPGYSLHDELLMLVEAGLTPLQALQAGTRNPSNLFPELSAGAIESGKRADLVLLEANPLEAIENIKRIRGVVARGSYFDKQQLDKLLEDSARFASQSSY